MASRRLLHIIASLAGLGLFILLFYRLGPRDILALLRQIGWGFAGILFIYGAQLLVRAAALSHCLPDQSRPRFRELLRVRLIGETIRGLTLTGPFISEPATAWLIKKQGVKTSEAAAATIAEYVAHSFVSAFLTILAVMYFRQYTSKIKELHVAALVLMYGSTAYLAIAALVLCRRVYFIGSIAMALGHIPGLQRRIGGNLEQVRRMEDALLFVLRDRPVVLMRLMALEITAHALLILETYWAMISMRLNASFLTALVAEGMTKLANVALFVGATEGAYAVLFLALGLPAAAGFTLSLLKRVRSLAIGLIGVGILAAFRRK